jgi:hypothetical protein
MIALPCPDFLSVDTSGRLQWAFTQRAARDRKIVKIEYNITDTRFVMSRRGAEKAAGGRRLICEQRESLRMGRRIIT